MLAELKRFQNAERWLIRRLRILVDAADERLHAIEMQSRATAAPVVVEPIIEAPAMSAPVLKLSKPRGKRRVTAAEFDLRYAR